MNPVVVIAEAGVNHNGDLELARELVRAGARAGADYVKFQTFDADRLVSRDARKAEYQARNSGGDETQYAMLKRLQLTEEMHRILLQECASAGVGFLSTPFDELSADQLVELGVPLLKISSGDITNVPFLRHLGSKKLPTILSTGMANLGEVEAAVHWLTEGGLERERITLLHCTSEYPAPLDSVNLRAMETLRTALGLPVGYSDHTLGTSVAVAAAALGATVIEKHFTLDRNLPGPDHKASLLPEELERMIREIREVSRALGSPRKGPSPQEIATARIVRKGVVAARRIEAGEPFTAAALSTRRPLEGAPAELWDLVLQSKAARAYNPGEAIEL